MNEIKEKQNIKYVLYARKSSESEEKQVQSIESQVKRLEELASSKGYVIIGSYTESKSAKHPNNRQQFNEMVKLLKDGKASGILCWHLNRLSRNPEEAGLIMGMLERGEIKHIRTPEHDYLPSDNVVLMSVEFGMANQYSRDLSEVVKRGLEDKLSNGGLTWLAPCGYLNDRNTHGVVKDPERFTLMRQAWDLMLTGGYSVTQILHKLNNEWGYRTQKRKKIGGGHMAKSHLYSVFTNPFYAGIIRCKGQEYKGNHEPMITLEEFDRVQTLFKSKGKPRTKIKEMAYRGFIRCGECGCMITGDIKHKFIKSTQKIKNYTYYGCTRKRIDYECTQKKVIIEEKLEELIAKEIEKITILPEFRDLALEILNQQNDEEISLRTQIYKTQHKTLEETQTHLDNLTQMRYRNLLSDEEYLKEKDKLQEQIKNLQSEVASTEMRAQNWLQLTEQVFDFATNALEAWKNGSLQKKKEIVMGLGQNFILKDGILTLEFNKWFIPIKNNYKKLEGSLVTSEPQKSTVNKKPTRSFDEVSFSWLGC